MEYALAVGWILTIAGFLWYVNQRDKREQDLLDRIQAPEVATTFAFRDKPDMQARVTYSGEEEEDGSRTHEAQAS